MTFVDIRIPKIAALQQSNTPWGSNIAPQASAIAIIFLNGPSQKKGDAAPIVLTRRTAQVSTHKRQISFPGGRRDSSDFGPIQTALRECSEELGADVSTFDYLGTLASATEISGPPVVPVVFQTSQNPSEFCPARDEVDDLIIEPWTTFTTSQHHQFRMNMFGVWRTSDLYRFRGHSVWGLTAGILTKACFH